MDRSASAISRSLLTSLRTGESPDADLAALDDLSESDLRPVRENRAVTLAFWTNLYNAGTQLLLERSPERYERLRTLRFFRATAVTVGGTALSLDRIEHGILRGSRSKYGLGYLPRVFVDSFELRYRLADPDPRIHFALNCGAASCPAIRAYDPERIDEQLDRATRAYLDGTVEYDPEAGVARVPRLFQWYRGDFGDPAGIRALLREYEAIPEDATPSLKYDSWDWSRAKGKFVE